MNKPITPEEMKAYVRSTWKKCQAEVCGDGEPVAIGWYIEGFSCVLGPIRPEVRYEEWRPFYALRTPPTSKPWVGLTEEERIMCRSYDPEEAVAKTEAKLKEKNA